MKVLHLIPAAFNYFDDIKSDAFRLVENLQQFDVEVEAFTLHYGTGKTAQKSEEEVKILAPSRRYIETLNAEKLPLAFDEYDIAHLHCPLFGAARAIIKWKRQSTVPLVITYYRQVTTADFFSWFIVWYNKRYLPRLFDLATVVTASSEEKFKQDNGWRYLKEAEKLVIVDKTMEFLGNDLTGVLGEVQLTADERLAYKYALIYQQLLS